MNVHGLSLTEGQRYYVCVLANATEVLIGNTTEHLNRHSQCSNGIVVDKTPPIAGQAWIGSRQKHWRFQVGHSYQYMY